MPPSINVSTSPTAITRKPPTTAAKGSTVLKRGATPTQKTNVSYKRREATALQRQQQQGNAKGEDSNVETSTGTTTSTELSTNTTPNNGDNLMTGMGAGGMYGSAGGYGMMSPYSSYGMMGMGMGGYGMGMGGYGMGMMGGPFSGLNNFLFGVQNVIFSLGQAVQILGMNTHALQQLFQTAKSMIDHTLSTLNQVRLLDETPSSRTLTKHQTEEEKKRRRRLKALRWSLVLSVSYAAYRIVRYLVRRSSRQRRNGRYLSSSPSSSYLQRGAYAPNSNSYHDDYYSRRLSGMGDVGMHHEPSMYDEYGDRMSGYTSSMGRQRYNNTGGGRWGTQSSYGNYGNYY